jgi:hypothetical protein
LTSRCGGEWTPRLDYRDEARTMLAAIYNWFTEGFDTADLIDAKILIDQLAG